MNKPKLTTKQIQEALQKMAKQAFNRSKFEGEVQEVLVAEKPKPVQQELLSSA